MESSDAARAAVDPSSTAGQPAPAMEDPEPSSGTDILDASPSGAAGGSKKIEELSPAHGGDTSERIVRNVIGESDSALGSISEIAESSGTTIGLAPSTQDTDATDAGVILRVT